MSGSRSDNQHYRRGVILGLTLAELMLLLIFALMLLLVGKIKISDKELVDAQEKLVLAEKKLQIIQGTFGESSIDITKEYVLMTEKLAAAQAKEKEAETALILAEEAKKLWPEKDAEEAMKKMSSAAKTIQQLEASQTNMQTEEKNLEDIVSDLNVCKGQIANFEKQLGNGLDHPPCWPNGKGGTEYIFDAVLLEHGILLRDRKVKEYSDKQALLPIKNIKFETPMTIEAFKQATTPIYQWSVNADPECRFAVRLFDKTEAGSKETYKRRKKAVEGHFYISERANVIKESPVISTKAEQVDEQPHRKSWLERQFSND